MALFKLRRWVGIFVLTAAIGDAAYAAELVPVVCEGGYKLHLQGVCAAEAEYFWSFTNELVKTDLAGKVQKQVAVPGHHGDLCCHGGQLYVAVTLGKARTKGEANCWVYVYKAEDLALVTRHSVPEAVHGAGGIAYHNGRYIVVGGLPEGREENVVYEYDSNFKFVRQHFLKSGYTKLGIQTATFAAGHWWFGCYGQPGILLKADEDFRQVLRFDFNCSVGITSRPSGEILIARGTHSAEAGYSGKLLRARPNRKQGLIMEKRTVADTIMLRSPFSVGNRASASLSGPTSAGRHLLSLS